MTQNYEVTNEWTVFKGGLKCKGKVAELVKVYVDFLDSMSKLYKNNTKAFWGYAIELIRQSGQHLPMTYYTLYLRMFGDTYNGKNVSDYFIISYGNVWYNRNL